ncbi:MAG: hypothetical protein COS27_08385 [Nitrospirae bacterium CG02_land_8_20_14_3_00_41_53]|nr:MAG: hypothetical protein COV68_04980 [Nitrospirae bacterium CG11_big_fil_rev_8_21_14_0_20_41_14]PIV41901.1 MAG: hypothetical protein COS27_08385 [Nitrospirae bacterium CG02_land_8_20_14_3_00_41_53]
MKNQNEYERRCKAIQFYKDGYGFNKILQLVQRSRRWLSKWLKRFKEHGFKGLKDRSRTPKRICGVGPWGVGPWGRIPYMRHEVSGLEFS